MGEFKHVCGVNFRSARRPPNLLAIWWGSPQYMRPRWPKSMRALHIWEAKVQVYAGRKE